LLHLRRGGRNTRRWLGCGCCCCRKRGQRRKRERRTRERGQPGKPRRRRDRRTQHLALFYPGQTPRLRKGAARGARAPEANGAGLGDRQRAAGGGLWQRGALHPGGGRERRRASRRRRRGAVGTAPGRHRAHPGPRHGEVGPPWLQVSHQHCSILSVV
jgi:hypothetical protein